MNDLPASATCRSGYAIGAVIPSARLPPRRAAGFEAGDRDAERGAGHVVEAGFVEEVHGVGVAAVLAAHADLQVGSGGAAFVHGDADEAADAVAVDGLERGDAEDAELEVAGEERAFHVVAGEAPAHLGEIVGTEGEELR